MTMTACCGLDCEECPARQATLANDQALREKTARQWSAMFQAEIAPEQINCLGCNSQGPFFGHCQVCEIRACCHGKGYATCAPCPDFGCRLLEFVHQAVPQAREALVDLRQKA